MRRRALARRQLDKRQLQVLDTVGGLIEQPIERLAPYIVEHQHRLTGIAHKLQRPRRPRSVELIS